MDFEILKSDAALTIPAEVAICPICKGKLTAEFEDWIEAENRLDQITSTRLTCETEPDLDDEWFDVWFSIHYAMPYADWVPVCIKVTQWINSKYRFDLDAEEREKKVKSYQERKSSHGQDQKNE